MKHYHRRIHIGNDMYFCLECEDVQQVKIPLGGFNVKQIDSWPWSFTDEIIGTIYPVFPYTDKITTPRDRTFLGIKPFKIGKVWY